MEEKPLSMQSHLTNSNTIFTAIRMDGVGRREGHLDFFAVLCSLAGVGRVFMSLVMSLLLLRD